MADALLSDELRLKLEELARRQNREPAEVLEDAVRRYAATCRLELFSEKLEKHAGSLGISEDDVPRLVNEMRRENESSRR